MNIVFMSMDTLPSTLWARDLYDQIKRRKAQGLQDRYLYDYTFANDNGQNPLMDKARA